MLWSIPESVLNKETGAMEDIKEYKKVSYWSVVWGQFKKNRMALWGLGAIGALFLLAVYSPIISLDVPFFYSIDGKTYFPFFTELFNENRFENSVDIFFNYIMVFSPVFVGGWFLLRNVMKRSVSNTALCLVSGFIVFSVIMTFCSPTFKTSYVNYKAQINDARDGGMKASAVFPIISYSYREMDSLAQNPQPPSSKHLLGTDAEGRDVFARMLYGTRISMTIGVVAVSIYMLIGIVLGALAGYFGGAIDIWISRIIEVVICFPTFFLILTLAAFIEKRTVFHVMILIGVVSWTGVARLVRGEFLRQRGMDYVQAAIALGISTWKIIFTHILPNAMGPILVSATFGIASAILTESGLSFLGLGDPTAPSWGGILNVGRQQGKLWLILAPGFAIFFIVSVFNLVGEAIRDAMDPRLRQ